MSFLHRDALTHVDCESDVPGHVLRPDVVAKAAASDGTPWLLTRVGPHRIGLVDPSGTSVSWWLHDTRPFARHRLTSDPRVWAHDDGVVRVGDLYVSVTTRERWLPCEDVVVRHPEREVAWLVGTGGPDVPADVAALVPSHTATLYHLEPPLEVPGRDGHAGPIDWVLVLAYHHRGRGVTALYEADATGRILSNVPLPGSHTDGTDHVRALGYVGYEVALPPRR